MSVEPGLFLVIVCLTGCVLVAYVQGRHVPIVEAFFQGRCNRLSPCHQQCVELVGGGYECACRQGFTLQANGFSCFPTLTFSDDESGEDVDRWTPSSSPEGNADHLRSPSRLNTNADAKTEPADLSHHGAEVSGSSWDRHEILDDDSGHEEQRNAEKFKDVATNSNTEWWKSEIGGNRRDSGTTLRQDNADGRRRRRPKRVLRRDRLTSFDPDKPTIHTEGGGLGIPDLSSETSIREPNVRQTVAVHLSSAAAGGPPEGVDPSSPSPALQATKSCEELHCAANGRCVHDPKIGGVRCLCSLGTHGLYCELDLATKYPKFSGLGYIAFPVLRGAHRELAVALEFRPEKTNGLLLFSADHPQARFDFFSVSLVNGIVEFRFDCGSGMAVIRSTSAVRIGHWNRVVIQRNEWNAGLRLNSGTPSNGRSKGKFSHINFREDLYLGGFDALGRISDRIGVDHGFVGCVRHLQVNERTYDMRKGAFVGDAIQGLDVEDCSGDVCTRLQCLNGGSCVANGADVGICHCPMGTAGPRCQSRIDVHVPMFNGTSFLQFIGLQRTVLSFTEVEMVVKPTDGEGLVFYNGYARDRTTGDFISLALSGGYVEYRFDLGTGAALIRSPHPIDLNEWHTIRFSRTGRNGFLKVDDQRLVEGMASGAFTQLTLTLDLFIGGHRNFDEVAKAAQVTKSFRGCIQKAIINKRPIKLLEELMTGVNVENCDHPCARVPCFNRGRCIPLKDTFTCSCPLHFHSKNCEAQAAEPVKVPAFSGDSYLLYVDSAINRRTRGKSIDIEMWIKPRKPDGLLFWVSEEEASPYSDYLAVGMKGGHAHLSYNLGSGEVVITNNHTRIDNDRWHRLRVLRVGKNGSLQIDDLPAAEGVSPGNMKQLTTHGTIFIGGMDDIVHGTLHKYSAGFVGCIANVTLATDHQVELIADASEGSNVKECHTERLIS